MRKNALLFLLTLGGAALAWLPMKRNPGLDLPLWTPLVLIAVWAGLPTVLSGGRWRLVSVAATVGSSLGLLYSVLTSPPPEDVDAAVLDCFIMGIGTLIFAMIAVVVALIVRKIRFANPNLRRAAWTVLACCFAFGPIVFAISPQWVQWRIARNDRLASQRFEALKAAVERTRAEVGGEFCDGAALKRHYSGPPFADKNWSYIAGNYVTQDGYVYGIWCRARHDEYTIDVHPAGSEYGARQFCANQFGEIPCNEGWLYSGPCSPCPR